MNEEQAKASAAARALRASAPMQLDFIVKYVEKLQSDADHMLRSANPEGLLRQNQGKAQLCEELLQTLNT